MAEYDLFLDESGTFVEQSTDAAERAAHAVGGRTFPSQLAGLLVPRGALTEPQAQDLLQRAHDAAGWPLPPVVHLNKYWQDPAYFRNQDDFNRDLNKFVGEVLRRLKGEGYQPVRLVNSEGVRYGTKAQHYTNMVAELFIRVCRQKRREGMREVSISLTCARVLLTVPRKHILGVDEYEKRLREYLAVAAVHRGLAADSRDWLLASATRATRTRAGDSNSATFSATRATITSGGWQARPGGGSSRRWATTAAPYRSETFWSGSKTSGRRDHSGRRSSRWSRVPFKGDEQAAR
jgi:hypothetical protein